MNQAIKNSIKSIIPPVLLNLLRDLKYDRIKWEGNYSNWQRAKEDSAGYDAEIVFKKVFDATMEVKRGNAAYERDSVLFYEKKYNFKLMTALLLANKKKSNLNVVDFGGALGSLYFQHRTLIEKMNIRWTVVEQERFYDLGKQCIQTDHLQFSLDLNEVNTSDSILILSSVLQYLSEPYTFIDRILEMNYPFIFIDRTGINAKASDRLTVQSIPSSIYKTSYPCWFFYEQKLLDRFLSKYNLVFDFTALDEANIPSKYKGYFFELKS